MAPLTLERVDMLLQNFERNPQQALKNLIKERKKGHSVFVELAIADLQSKLGVFDDADSTISQLVQKKSDGTHLEPEYLKRLYNIHALHKKRQTKDLSACPNGPVLEYFKAAAAEWRKRPRRDLNTYPMVIYFQCALAHSAWGDLNQACRNLLIFRPDPDVYFLTIALNLMICEHLQGYKMHEGLLKLLDQLSPREVNKAVEQTVSGKDGSAKITSYMHLDVAIDVLVKQGFHDSQKRDAVLKLFNDTNTGPLKVVAGQNRLKFFIKKVETLRELGRSGDLDKIVASALYREYGIMNKKACNKLVETKAAESKLEHLTKLSSGLLDNQHLWALWAGAVVQLRGTGDRRAEVRLQKLIDAVEGVAKHKKSSIFKIDLRGPMIARIILNQDNKPRFIACCKLYMAKFGKDLSVARDLLQIKNPRLNLVKPLRNGNKLSPGGGDWLLSEKTVLSYEYHVILQRSQGKPFPYATADIFITRCVRIGAVLQKTSSVSGMAWKEALFLAACMLLRTPAAGIKRNDGSPDIIKEYRAANIDHIACKVQAAFLLSLIVNEEPRKLHNRGHLLLIKTLLSLGLGNLAFGHWPGLKVKHFLADSLGGVLTSRMAIQHPHAVPMIKNLSSFSSSRGPETIGEELGNQIRDLEKGMPLFVDSRGVTLKPYATEIDRQNNEQSFEARDKKQNSVAGVIERVDFTWHRDNSLTKALLKLEIRRLRRLAGTTVGDGESTIGPIDTLVDNRDKCILSGVERPEYDGSCDILKKPIPGESYLVQFLVIENLQSLIDGETPLMRFGENTDSPTPHVFTAAEVQESPDMTTPERNVVPIWTAMQPVVLFLTKKRLPEGDFHKHWSNFQTLFGDAFSQTHVGRVLGVDIPMVYSSDCLEALLLSAEVLLYVSKLCSKATELLKQPWIKPYLKSSDVDAVVRIIKRATKDLVSMTKLLKNSGPDPDIMLPWKKYVLGAEHQGNRLLQVLDPERDVVAVSRDFDKAANEGLAGVLKVFSRI